jgi:hypothetical protein
MGKEGIFANKSVLRVVDSQIRADFLHQQVIHLEMPWDCETTVRRAVSPPRMVAALLE